MANNLIRLISSYLLGLCVPMTFCGICIARDPDNPNIPSDLDESYRVAELSAPAAARLDLEALRKQSVINGWKFKIGYTTAFERPLSSIATTRIPESFLAIAMAQNEFAKRANAVANESARLAGIKDGPFLEDCNPDLEEFNWRDKGKVNPRESSQKSCGSCWAFSAAATYDTAFRIRNHVDIEISEQDVLNCAVGDSGKRAGDCSGGWYHPVFQWLVANGAASRDSFPYVGSVTSCAPNLARKFRAISSGFVSSQTSVPLIREMKSAICQYGAVSAAIEATIAFQAYAGGYFNERSAGTINHAISIVGWNDNAGGKGEGAWLIKNSWDKRWGENGFAWVSYRSNSVGYAAAWVRPLENSVQIPTSAIASAWSTTLPKLRLASNLVSAVDENNMSSTGGTPPTGGGGTRTTDLQISSFGTVAGTHENSRSRPVVWIQFSGADQRNDAEAIREALTNAGFFAPAIEDLSKKHAILPRNLEVRSFNRSLGTAGKVVRLLKSIGRPAKIVRLQGIGEGAVDAVEVWLPKG